MSLLKGWCPACGGPLWRRGGLGPPAGPSRIYTVMNGCRLCTLEMVGREIGWRGACDGGAQEDPYPAERARLLRQSYDAVGNSTVATLATSAHLPGIAYAHYVDGDGDDLDVIPEPPRFPGSVSPWMAQRLARGYDAPAYLPIGVPVDDERAA